MKAKIEVIYEELCCTLKDMDIEKCYYLAIMGMNRTLCLCSKIVKYDFFKNMLILRKFIKENNRDIFDHKQTYSGYNEVCYLFDELSDNWENYIFDDLGEIQDVALNSGLYEFMEAWYAFLGVINSPYKDYTPEKMVFFITLPIRYLESYLTSYFIDCIDEKQLQEFVNDHEIIENEIERIFLDIQLVLSNNREAIYERMSFYSELDILEWMKN